MRAPRHLFLFLFILLCFVPSIRAQEATDALERARQLAAAANDNAVRLDERQAALQQLQEAVNLFLSVNERLEAARVLNRAGRLQFIINKPQDAVHSYRQAISLVQQTPALETKVDSLNGLGEVYVQMARKSEAEDVLRQSLELSEQAGYLPGRAQALLTLSDRQNYDDHALALDTAQEALALWQSINDKPGIARTYAQIGQYNLAQSLLPEATQNYQQALAIWRDLNTPTEQARVLIMLAIIEYRKGAWSSSIAFYTQAQGLLDERAEPIMMGQIAAGLAEAFNENGLPETALPHYQRALDYYQQTEDPHLKGYATWGLGVTHYLSENYTEAITRFQQALAILEDDPLEGACYEYLGRAYISTGEYELARQQLQSAEVIYREAANPMERARVIALMGQISEQRGQLERARQYYQQALKTFSKLSDRVNQAVVYYALGRLELKRQNNDAAADYLQQSIEATENIRRVSNSRDLTAAFSARVYERYQTYIECLMRKHQAQPARGLDVLAFEMSELARARSLAELLRATETNLVPGLDPQLAEQERSLRRSLRAKEDLKVALMNRAEYKKADFDVLEAERARMETEYKQVHETIRARYPSYEQLTRPIAWNLRHIQEQVLADDQTVLLEYSLGTDKSYVWCVSRGKMKSYELPSLAEITRAAQEVYTLLAVHPGANTEKELTSATQQLSRMVLSPLAPELDKLRIIIVADGALNFIPFQMLLSANNEPLSASHEIVNAPSASILGELQQETARRQPASKVLAAFGDPVFASNYAQSKDANGNELVAAQQAPDSGHLRQALRDIELNENSFDPSVIKPLFYAKRELARLRDLASGGGAYVAEDFAATREQLLSTDLTQYAILHFATHGFLDSKRPENSGLVLSTINRDGQSQDGFVGLQDIYQLRAPVGLVVLSACQTAIGKNVRGEGLMGLTRGFMYAGASSVVASLWKADDEATAELMNQFYTNMLQKGMPPAAALRAAQSTIRQNPLWRSPHFWAAFILQGEYRQAIQPTPLPVASKSYRTFILGGFLTVLLAGGAYWYARRKRRAAKHKQ